MRSSKSVGVPKAESQHMEPADSGGLLEPKQAATQEIQVCVHSLASPLSQLGLLPIYPGSTPSQT